MGNDNKIDTPYIMPDEKGLSVQNPKSEVLLFLQEELVPIRRKKRVTTYDLEREYAKTRKNKNYSIWITLALTVVGVVLATWGIMAGVSAADKQNEVALEAFEDLNLKRLFDALSKTQDLYEKASKTKAELQAALDAKLLQAKRTRDSDLEYIKKLSLSRAARLEREQRIFEAHKKAVASAHDEFDEKLSVAELELKQYEEQLKSFDSENVAKAQDWEKQMDSQRQIYEIEKTKLVEDYEAKIEELKKQMADSQERSYKEKRTALNDVSNHYEARIAKLDPVIRDGRINSIIQKSSSMINPDSFSVDGINSQVKTPDEEFTEELQNLKAKYDEYVALSRYSSGIPYSNGMDGLVRSERQIAYDMVFGAASAGAKRISVLKSENAQLAGQVESYRAEVSRLKAAAGNTAALLEGYAKTAKVDGIITGADSAGSIVVYMQKASRAVVKNDGSAPVDILDGDMKTVATGALWFKDNVYFVSLDEEDAEILPGYFVKITK